jgi:hypothetical protein
VVAREQPGNVWRCRCRLNRNLELIVCEIHA